MATFTTMDRTYETDKFLKEVISLAQLLATNCRLEDPLPQDTDLTTSEDKEIQIQIAAILALPPWAVTDFWTAFAANHLGTLATSLKALSPKDQPAALSTYIQILSLLPDPKSEPYFRRFLSQSPASKGLPDLVTESFVNGIDWKRPSGPGQICTLIIHFIFWCDPNSGEDGKASISPSIRTRLSQKLEGLKSSPQFSSLEKYQQVEIDRLSGLLKALEHVPHYVQSTRQYLEGQLDLCNGKPDCDSEEIGKICAKCKSVRYCGKACQTWHWKNGHKLRCFKAAF